MAFDHITLTDEQLKHLGLSSIKKASKDIGFTDQEKSTVFNIRNAFLDLENVGALHDTNPKLVIRKLEVKNTDNSADYEVLHSWRQALVSEHYIAKYKISTQLVGQLNEIHFPYQYYSYIGNDFFKPFRDTRAVKRLKKRNSFSYARFRFPEESANTIDIKIATPSGFADLKPKYPGVASKEEKRKTYCRWHPQMTRFPSGQSRTQYDNLNLSGFNIPYPTTLQVYESPKFNIPVKIAPKFNQDNGQYINGIIAISTGTAYEKTICYVSPHSIITGYENTIEDLYSEKYALTKSYSPGAENLMTVISSSWHSGQATGFVGCNKEPGFLNTANGDYKQATIPVNGRPRFYHLNDKKKQIYFDNTINTPYGSGTWVLAISGNSNLSITTGQKGILYFHEPDSLIEWKKTDPRTLNSLWKVASGLPNSASQAELNKAALSAPETYSHRICRKNKSVKTKVIQLPTLKIDSKFNNNGHVLPDGIYEGLYTYRKSIYPTWSIKVPKAIIGTGGGHIYDSVLGLTVSDSGYNIGFSGVRTISGYVINGQKINYQDVIDQGIQIPIGTFTGERYKISNNGHIKQDTPLKDTYFYKFYNQLYSNANKQIATGTWDGIIPSGVKFSVELISTSLETNVGIQNNKNLSVIYSGFGTNDSIDHELQKYVNRYGANILFPNPSEKYMVSGNVPWHQKRNPYSHTIDDNGNLVYFTMQSGPTEAEALNIAQAIAVKKLNSKILKIVNKLFPNLTYKNKKWKRMQALKQKIASLHSEPLNELSIDEYSLPGAQIKTRLRPYASGQV